MKQEFRKIPSLDFRYEVSRDGIVRNIKSKKIKKQFITKFGYYRTSYRVNKTNSHYSPNGWDRPLHQLVMECWGPQKPNENYVIDHIDQNKLNHLESNMKLNRDTINEIIRNLGIKPDGTTVEDSKVYDNPIYQNLIANNCYNIEE